MTPTTRFIPLSIMTILLLVAAATRIVGAGAAPLWTDEGHSLYIAQDPVARLLNNHHPPLYFAALNTWQSFAGDSRVVLRFLAIGASLLTLAATYRIGRDWLGAWAGCAAVALLAVLDLNIEYSQQVRHYGWLVLGVVLASLVFLRYLKTGRKRLLLPYVLCLLFLLYSHYLGFMLVPIHGLFGLFIWRGAGAGKRWLAAAWAATVVLYLPWIVAIRHLLILAQEGGLASRPGALASVAEALPLVAGLLSDGQVLLVFAFVAVGTWRVLRHLQRDTASVARLYVIAIGPGLLAAMLVMNPFLTVLTPRTLVFLTPALFLIFGYGLTALPPRLRALVLVVGIAAGLLTNQIVQPRYNSDIAASTLAQNYEPGDLIVLETGFDDNAFAYEVGQALDDASVEIITTLPWVTERYTITPVVPQIADALAAHRRVWVIQWLHAAQVMPYLDSAASGFMRTAAFEVPIGDIYATMFPDPAIDIVLFEKT